MKFRHRFNLVKNKWRWRLRKLWAWLRGKAITIKPTGTTSILGSTTGVHPPTKQYQRRTKHEG